MYEPKNPSGAARNEWGGKTKEEEELYASTKSLSHLWSLFNICPRCNTGVYKEVVGHGCWRRKLNKKKKLEEDTGRKE